MINDYATMNGSLDDLVSPITDVSDGGVRSMICSNHDLIQFKLKDPSVILAVICLIIINLAVVASNILVIVAVFVSSKLRTVTNFFIVSLAVADLLLGITVVPYSLCLAVLDVWIFGEFWCLGWLVIDVWLSTASILNLCAISVDRYLAVTRPVRYRSIMTSQRAKLIIAFVWILSFIVSFPPLLGWNQSGSIFASASPTHQSTSSSSTSSSSYKYFSHEFVEHVTKAETTNSQSSSRILDSLATPYSAPLDPQINDTNRGRVDDCFWRPSQCVLFTSTGYVTYSALGSFYIPMSFMMFFYWRIYIVASRATRALRRGYKTTGRSKGESHGCNEERLTLRIHRGYICEGSGGGGALPHIQSNSHNMLSSTSSQISESVNCDTSFINNNASPKPSRSLLKLTKYHPDGCDEYAPDSGKKLKRMKRKKPITVYKLTVPTVNENGKRNSTDAGSSPSSPACSTRESNKSNTSKTVRFSKRVNTTGKWQTKRLLAETKAAKTVGIIVGGFIICWFPFFTIYLIRGYCKDQNCIPQLMLTIFTWLGYTNSAVNPIIYGLFSRDFRRAFANIICRCKYSEETGVSSLIRQIHLPNLFEDENHDDIKTDSQDDGQ